jgi:hypothetical protein
MATQLYKVQDSQGNVRTLEGPPGATEEQVIAKANELLGSDTSYATEKQLFETGPANAKAPDGKTYQFPNELQAYNFTKTTKGVNPNSVAKVVMDYGGKLAPEAIPVRRSLGDVAEEAIANAPQSYTNMMVGIGNAIANPVETLTGMADVAAGGLRNVMPDKVRAFIDKIDTNPEAAKRATALANEFGGVYKERYGSIEALKNTIATDPVGAAGDLSMLLGGAGGVVRGVASVGGRLPARFAPASRFVGDVGNALSTASQYTNPLAPITGTLSLAGRTVGAAGNLGYRSLNPKANLLMEAAEGRPDELINALRNPTQIVPGSRPTAAQATAGTGLVRYQGLGAQAEDVLPTMYLTREMEQAAARRNALGTVAGTPADLQSARASRSATAQNLYQNTAFPQIVRGDPQFDVLAQRPAMQRAIQAAEELSRNQGRPFQFGQNTPATTVPSPILGANGAPIGSVTTPAQFAQYPVQSLHGIKIALDDMVKDPASFGLDATQAQAIKTTRTEYLRWLENKAPDYATARTTFARQSEPINQMEVGQYLEAKLLSPLDENAPQRAGMFAQAVRDAPGTIKRSTGQSRFENLSDVLTPDQVTAVNAVRDDLARMQQSKTMGARGKGVDPSLTKAATAAQEGLSSPNIMNRVAAIANMIVDKVRGRIDRQLAVEIATEMLNPADAARALEAAVRTQAKRDIFAAPFTATGSAITRTMRSPFLTMGGQMNNLIPSNENALTR